MSIRPAVQHALVALPFVVLAACGGESEPAVPAPPPTPPVASAPAAPPDPELERGRTAYARYCALCHGDRAQGYAADHANAIGNPAFLAIADDAFLRAAIVDGRPGTPMSAWGRAHGGPLADGAVDAIVRYLRSLATQPAVDVSQVRVSGSIERGAAVYAQRCVECHGARGEGSETATSISHPNFHRAASDGFIRHTIEHGREGTPMPGFGAELPSQTIDDLVAYVRSLEHMPDRPVEPGGDPPPGLADLIIHPDGAAPAFTMRENRFVPADAVKEALEQGRRMVILDARATSDWANGHIPGAAPFPFYDIEQMAQNLPRDGTWILAYCACPHAASGHVVDELRQRGFEHTAIIDEGIHYWMDHGYPIERGTAQ
ncbi:c-type cytochrome [Sandaracinus amylolyticus]|uniref:Cytochrome c oxidase subunit CcoP n=1 Tax=Sandaracinus amylolyticus TaxID=927083 RepID=A0A0F6YHU9_9BACT|nr:c-type cytochrome [Sandaracinus amylolyticus]AKF06038.1 Cytochrome c oxidase subunit CcoP [Sandaracinus amylolyticus]